MVKYTKRSDISIDASKTIPTKLCSRTLDIYDKCRYIKQTIGERFDNNAIALQIIHFMHGMA